MPIPRQPGKFSLEKLRGLALSDWTDTTRLSTIDPEIYTFETGGFRFDMLWHPASDPAEKRLFVLFSGDALREKYDPPVFQRFGWAPFFPGHCLFVSDPSIYLDDSLGLAWYAGTAAFDPMPVIAGQVERVCAQVGIAADDVYTYGSSGGGFAALRALTVLPRARAVAINPQTEITAYRHKTVERYLRLCFGTKDRAAVLATHPRRLSLIANADALTGRSIALIQNRLDTHHYEDHYKPLCAALSVDDGDAPEAAPVHRLLFDDKGGHIVAEPADVFDKTMRMVVDGRL